MKVWQRTWLGHTALALAGAAAAAVTIRLLPEPAPALPFWLGDGLLLGLLLTAPPGRRASMAISGAVGAAIGCALMGGFGPPALMTALSSIVLMLTALTLCRRHGWRVADCAAPSGMARFAFVTTVLAPLAAAVPLAVQAIALSPDTPDFVPCLRWLLAESLGVAVVLPIVLALRRSDAMLLLVPPLLGSTLMLIALHAAVTGIAFLQSRVPLGFIVFPPLLLMVARLGTPGAGIGQLILLVIALAGQLAGVNPARMLTAFDPSERLLFLHAFLLVCSLVAYPMGAAVVGRRRMNQALADQHARLGRNESLYRLLANHASDIITRVRFDGRRVYVSPSVTEVLGWTVAEAMRPDWQQNVHEDDIDGFTAAREQLRAGADVVTNTYRFRRKDGSWAWLEARMHVVRGADGAPKEFVANSRDITRQKEAEQALESALSELAELASTDGLTGVANRRRFDEALSLEWRRSMRSGETMSVLLIDADHFKSYNDRYGHQAGDDCLRMIASTIATTMRRPHDLVARYGGEEFAVILPGTDAAGARRVAQSILVAIELVDQLHEGNADGVVTVSIGVATLVPTSSQAPDLLVEAADKALYAAKRNGRNRAEVADALVGTATIIPLLPHLRRLAP